MLKVSHTHRRQHLWHILMPHPYALTLSAEPQHWAISRKEIRCKVENGERRNCRLRDLGQFSLW